MACVIHQVFHQRTPRVSEGGGGWNNKTREKKKERRIVQDKRPARKYIRNERILSFRDGTVVRHHFPVNLSLARQVVLEEFALSTSPSYKKLPHSSVDTVNSLTHAFSGQTISVLSFSLLLHLSLFFFIINLKKKKNYKLMPLLRNLSLLL